MSQCTYVGESHHSDDLLAVFHGRPEPTLICGFHEMSKGLPLRTSSLDYAQGNE